MLQGEHFAILLTFIKLPFVIKIFVLSVFEWPYYTGIKFTHVSFIALTIDGSLKEVSTIFLLTSCSNGFVGNQQVLMQ